MTTTDALRTLRVEVVYALPEQQHRVSLTLAEGATVADALVAVADLEPFSSLDAARVPLGIYGERVDSSRVLADGDRVELYRPLWADPRDVRRRRTES